MARKKLSLYVWDGYSPDYSDGLAFAIAHDEEEARNLIIEYRGFGVSEWGRLSIHALDTVFARAVSGGG